METDGSRTETQDGTLTVRIEPAGETHTIALSGELDMANAATLSAELERLEREGAGRLTIDMRELEFIDSTGIALLVAAHRRLNEVGERISFVASRAIAVRRVIEVTGLERELPFATDAGGAMEAGAQQ